MTKKTTTKTLTLEKEEITVPVGGRKRQRTVRNTATKNEPVIEIDDDSDDNENESLSSVPSSLSSLAGSTSTTAIQPSSEIIPETPQKEVVNNNTAKTPLQSNVASNKKKKSTDLNTTSMDEIDVILPPSLFQTNDCTLMIQVEPNDASLLEFHGASGAVGRFEANDQFVTMDLKGFQYSGTINPGPTAMVVSMHPMQSSSINSNSSGPVMKVESITDEFVTMSKAKDMMATFDAVVEKGDFDSSYFSKEIDVNAKQTKNKSKNNNKNDNNNEEEETENTNDNQKKKTPTKKKKITKTTTTTKSSPKELKKVTKRKK